MMQRQKLIIRALSYLGANWDKICLLIGFFGSATFFVVAETIPGFHESQKLLVTFSYLGVGALIFVLLDIHKRLGSEPTDDVEANFTAARPRMIDAIIAATHKRSSDPLVIRLVGMRLTAIQQFLADIAHAARADRFGHRSTLFKLYHVDPKFLAQQFPAAKKSAETPVAQRLQQQVAVLRGSIGEINAMFSKIHNIDIEIASYRSLPLFWAVEIDKRTLFWGFFTWDGENQNWIGPENECIVSEISGHNNSAIVEGILNRIESLDDWSEMSSNKPSELI